MIGRQQTPSNRDMRQITCERTRFDRVLSPKLISPKITIKEKRRHGIMAIERSYSFELQAKSRCAGRELGQAVSVTSPVNHVDCCTGYSCHDRLPYFVRAAFSATPEIPSRRSSSFSTSFNDTSDAESMTRR